jgi:hypothetical protein
MLLKFCPLVIKKVEDRLDDDTVPSVGVPISLLLPRTLPLKVSVDNGGELKTIVDPDMAYAEVYCTTPEIEIKAFASDWGTTATPPELKENETVDPLNPELMSSKIEY